MISRLWWFNRRFPNRNYRGVYLYFRKSWLSPTTGWCPIHKYIYLQNKNILPQFAILNIYCYVYVYCIHATTVYYTHKIPYFYSLVFELSTLEGIYTYIYNMYLIIYVYINIAVHILCVGTDIGIDVYSLSECVRRV